MNQNNMYLINKLFNDKTIRTVWNKDEEKYYISVVDVVGALTESKRSRKYWNDLKKKLVEEGSELSEKIGQLKLKASDGKYYNTDVCDIKEMFRIIESIPSKKAEPIKLWLANLGGERIDETFNPSIGIQRLMDVYRTKGYDENWISKRIKGIQDRKKSTDVWNGNGITKEVKYAILTNEIYKTLSGMTAKKYKEYKELRKESLRDNMSDIEVTLADLGELATRELAKKYKPYGLKENKEIARRGGNIANNTRIDLENEIGEPVISDKNKLDYEYVDNEKFIENKNES